MRILFSCVCIQNEFSLHKEYQRNSHCLYVMSDIQVLDCLADGMAFGALEPCKECNGQLVFKGDAYYCTGDISAWTKCVFKTSTPLRKDWVTPKVGVLLSELG